MHHFILLSNRKLKEKKIEATYIEFNRAQEFQGTRPKALCLDYIN